MNVSHIKSAVSINSVKILIPLLFFAAPISIGAQVLEEIVVTAQKREESIQDIGIAITAFSGELITSL